MKRLSCLIAAISIATQCLQANPLKTDAVSVARAGMDPDRVAGIEARMKSFVDRGEAAGIVTLAARKGQVVHFSAVGFQDLEKRSPMRLNSIFQVGSMTKPLTAIGIMILMEEGRLSIADPVEKHLPEFAGLQVKEPGGAGGSGQLKKPSRLITIRDLMSHTSGMSGGYPAEMKDLFNKRDRTLAEAVKAFARLPLETDPGVQWRYSNMGIATLGRIIEVVSGVPYEDFMARRLFEPLGMTDSHFFLPPEKRDRLAVIYRQEQGKLVHSGLDHIRKDAVYPCPEGGLYSTAEDFFRVYQMMLNGGALNGRWILSPASVRLMTTNHTGDLKAGFSPGTGFGLGWVVVKDVEGMFRLQSIGSYGHGGLWRTIGWVDPEKDLAGVVLLQRIGGGGDMADEFNAFMGMIGSAVVE